MCFKFNVFSVNEIWHMPKRTCYQYNCQDYTRTSYLLRPNLLRKIHHTHVHLLAFLTLHAWMSKFLFIYNWVPPWCPRYSEKKNGKPKWSLSTSQRLKLHQKKTYAGSKAAPYWFIDFSVDHVTPEILFETANHTMQSYQQPQNTMWKIGRNVIWPWRYPKDLSRDKRKIRELKSTRKITPGKPLPNFKSKPAKK